MTEIDSVGIVGFGTMGAGIAEVVARSGKSVTAVVPDDAAEAAGTARLEASTARAVERGKLTAEERAEVLARITVSRDLADLKSCGLVIEAVPEKLELKKAIFAELDAILPPEAILASNTSALRITELAVATGRPGRVVGVHFFNPAPVLDLVELENQTLFVKEVLSDERAAAFISIKK